MLFSASQSANVCVWVESVTMRSSIDWYLESSDSSASMSLGCSLVIVQLTKEFHRSSPERDRRVKLRLCNGRAHSPRATSIATDDTRTACQAAKTYVNVLKLIRSHCVSLSISNRTFHWRNERPSDASRPIESSEVTPTTGPLKADLALRKTWRQSGRAPKLEIIAWSSQRRIAFLG